MTSQHERPLRFGVIGTGPWAAHLHLPAAASSERVTLSALLGRDAGRTAALAATVGATPFTDLQPFLDAVDVVGFAVPPEAQAGLALAAARAGKHLLLEKPVATSAAAARELVAEVESRGLATVVFFTQRLMHPIAEWIEETRAVGGWSYGRVESFSSVLVDTTSPYNASAWRHERGSLWDLGPHAMAMLSGVLGRITEVAAVRGPGDLTSLSFTHESGAQGSVTTTLDARPAATGGATWFAGTAGRVSPPAEDGGAEAAYCAALASIADSVQRGGPAHDCDIHFGAYVVDVLEAAERAIASGGREAVLS